MVQLMGGPANGTTTPFNVPLVQQFCGCLPRELWDREYELDAGPKYIDVSWMSGPPTALSDFRRAL